MVKGEKRLGGMGLFIIKELVDEAGFVESDDDGNQFRMVIYRVEAAAKSEASEPVIDNGGTT